MPSQGPFYVNDADEQDIGSEIWHDPTDMTDGPGFAFTHATGNEFGTNTLRGSSCGFSIPTGATINGVEVSFSARRSNPASDAFINYVARLLNNNVGASLSFSEVSLTDTFTTYTAGSPTNHGGGAAPSPAQVNANGLGQFGGALSGYGDAIGLSEIEIDWMAVKVYYTEASSVSIPIIMHQMQQQGMS